MGLISQILSRFSKSNPVTGGAMTETTQTGFSSLFEQGFWSNAAWKCDPDRKAVYDDIEMMDSNCTVTSQALDTIAEVAIGLEEGFNDRFTVTCENQEAIKVINDCISRLHLRKNCKDIIRKMVKHGNEFREIVIGADYDGQLKIMNLREDMPSYTFYANLDKHGNQDQLYPWVQKASPWFWGKEAKFRPFQLAHWQYGETVRKIGKPMLAPARQNWKRLEMMEDTMALARMLKAYYKMVHHVPVSPRSSPEQQMEIIKQYKDNRDQKEFWNWAQGKQAGLKSPITADTDIFLPEDGSGRAKIDVVDPKNSSLGNLDDVQYSQSKHICRLGVPRRYLNLEGASSSALNQGDGSGKEDEHFSRKIRDVQSCYVDGLSYLINVELLLHGIYPMNGEGSLIYEIQMSRFNTGNAYQKAQAEKTNADALNSFLKVLEMPEELIEEKFLCLTEAQKRKYGKDVKIRKAPNPAMQTGGQAGAPEGQRPGSNISKNKKP